MDVKTTLSPPTFATPNPTPDQGEIYYDTVAKTLKWWDGDEWIDARGSAVVKTGDIGSPDGEISGVKGSIWIDTSQPGVWQNLDGGNQWTNALIPGGNWPQVLTKTGPDDYDFTWVDPPEDEYLYYYNNNTANYYQPYAGEIRFNNTPDAATGMAINIIDSNGKNFQKRLTMLGQTGGPSLLVLQNENNPTYRRSYLLSGYGAPNGNVLIWSSIVAGLKDYVMTHNDSVRIAVYPGQPGSLPSNGQIGQVLKWIGSSPTWYDSDIPVSSLPSSPRDGQIVNFLADSSNGIIWRFRYRSSSGNWEFIGGPPLFSEVYTAQATSTTSYTTLSSSGPSIVLPLRGDFDIGLGVRMQASAAAAIYMSYMLGGSTQDVDAVTATFAAAGVISVSRHRRQYAVSASQTLDARYKTSAGSATFTARWMSVLPVRCW
jgi:hypothetical protein